MYDVDRSPNNSYQVLADSAQTMSRPDLDLHVEVHSTQFHLDLDRTSSLARALHFGAYSTYIHLYMNMGVSLILINSRTKPE